jgi:metallophosphoesterase superfamily enzyme
MATVRLRTTTNMLSDVKHQLLLSSFQPSENLPSFIQMMQHQPYSLTRGAVDLLSITLKRESIICHQLCEPILDRKQ